MLLLLAGIAGAQAKDAYETRAEKVIKEFGTAGLLDSPGHENWIAAELFSTLDTFKTGDLDADEYKAAYLFVDPVAGTSLWPTTPASYNSAQSNAAFETLLVSSTVVDLALLREDGKCPAFQLVVKDRAAGRWNALSRYLELTNSKPDEDGLARWFRHLARKAKRATSPKGRLGTLESVHLNYYGLPERTETALDVWKIFHLRERLQAADKDGGGAVDFQEYRTSIGRTVADCIDFAILSEVTKTRWVPVEAVWAVPLASSGTPLAIAYVRTNLASRIGKAATTSWASFYSGGDAPLSLTDLAKHFKAEADKNTRPTDAGLIPGTGYAFSGRKKNDDGLLKLDKKSNHWVLRVVKDYDKAGAGAEPVLLSWSEEDGESSAVVNGALRLSRMGPSNWSPVIGLRVDRSGKGDERIDRRRYFIGAELFTEGGDGFWQAALTRAGLRFDDDFESGLERIAGVIDVEMALEVGGIKTGQWTPLGPGSKTSVLWQPTLGIEIDEITKKSAADDEDEGSYGRGGLDLGIKFLGQATFTNKALFRVPIGGAAEDEHFYNDASLSWAFDETETVTLTLNWRRGEDAPAFDDRDVVTLSLGVRF